MIDELGCLDIVFLLMLLKSLTLFAFYMNGKIFQNEPTT